MITIYTHGAPVGQKIELVKEHDYHFTTIYQSVIGTAIAEIIEDPKEKAHGLTLLINRETKDTFKDTNYSAHELAHVQVTKYTAQHLGAKQYFKAKA